MSNLLKSIFDRNPNEPEFHQAVDEVYETVEAVLKKNPKYQKAKLFERMTEPERLISFRVTWVDDKGEVQINKGYRVQMNSAIGPYKGGLRFHPTVTPSVLKFLAFEQIFKNALTGLPMGGGKGGSDFDPKGKSDAEIMRFCQAFMTELSRHIGHRLDVPAGDIGVGGREIGYMFGQYKKIQNEFTGVLTGKGQGWGGSLIRPEATGYGLVYFAQNMLAEQNDSLKGKVCLISGSGNVAQYAMKKLCILGAKPVTCSDSSGYIYDEDGITQEKIEFIMKLKNEKRGRISEYAKKFKSAKYFDTDRKADHNPLWAHKADCAFPCATQNEINKKDAANLIKAGVKLLAEGANMPTMSDAIVELMKGGVNYAPGKASNAGGVGTSGLEMVQNYSGIYWTREEVDSKLKEIMKEIHDSCLKAAKEYGMEGNYQAGANIAGFVKVADAMLAQGIV
ncbi:NADP-specific glutamate dehydrogenase [Fulvivirga lutea]|uniref:Glutamate dehydrogenase n=1 Tax=Fulvivirga lutea TaxID=2810512 RepID=A0A975A191_9BACT|nr:NADP-specific glutamate dehydrogenase [Fulvivirga lutea]QSE98199.1 NADP-specific glutamate dehydrogenase [Fulvivirga lutea]